MFLLEDIQVVPVINLTSAGTTAVNGSVLDMSGYNNVMFVCHLGTLTSTQVTSLKLQTGTVSNGSDMADVTGAVTGNAADADGNKVLILDCERSLIFPKRYARCVVNRGTANAQILSVVAYQYRAKNVKQTQAAANVSQSLLAK